ncbi:MAG: xanthine dehydrogenase family protein molybdopterin-binding subunit [Chloroflexi bacterium]|nr:xanthine dehydrogenase family protein molybdopterin-binding subunit [Chloroflexota bacterium]
MTTTRSALIAPRLDAVEKVTGAATYAADLARPGMLWAKALRSPLPHARLMAIDVRRARALPGVHAVLSGADLPEVLMGRSTRDMPVLARDKVRFIGEKVAAVAADDLETAEQALELIEVEYEPLAAVFDPLEAMQPGAPLLHDPAAVRARATPRQVVADYPNSVSNPTWGASVEEMERAFAQADHVFEHTFRFPPQHQGYLEPHACLVELDARGVAHIWASNKAPFLLLNYLNWGLGLTRDQVQVHLLPVGGCFGGKGSFMDIPLAYFLARASGRPVKMAMTYAEELMAANPRHAAVVTVKSGFSADGRLLARSTRAVYASGAYAAFKPAPDAALPGIRLGGVAAYPTPLSRVEGHMVYTNTVPGGHMRAPGEAQPVHAIECHMDLCARAMGKDPLELRLLNAPTVPRETPSGAPGSPPRAREVLQAAARAIGWGQPKPEGVGRGIALVEVGNSPGLYAAELVVERGGQVVLHTPIVEQGAGMLTVFRQLLAEAWGLPLDRVRVEQTTQGFEYDRGVGGSRVTRLVGRMIELLSQRLQARLAGLLAAELGQAAEAVAVEPGGFRAPDGRFHTVAEAAALAEADLAELLRFEPGRFDVVEVYAAQAAEVAVDRETGRVQVKRVVTAHEVGRIVHPVLHQGQIDGGLIQGLGYALTEGLVFEDGRVANLNLHEYKLPCAADLPPLETILLPQDLSLGITPIGEGPNIGMSACLANAVVDALGPRPLDLPLSPDVVRRLAL